MLPREGGKDLRQILPECSNKGRLCRQRMTCSLENISVQNAWTELWSGSRLSLEAHLVNIWSLQEAALSWRELGYRDCDFGIFKGGKTGAISFALFLLVFLAL